MKIIALLMAQVVLVSGLVYGETGEGHGCLRVPMRFGDEKLPKEAIDIAEIVDKFSRNSKVKKVIKQPGLDVKVVVNLEQLIGGLERIINQAGEVEVYLSQDGRKVKIDISSDGKVVSDEVIEELSRAIKDAGGEIKVDSLTVEEYEKFQLPDSLYMHFNDLSERDKQVIKKYYPVIEKYIKGLIVVIDELIDLFSSSNPLKSSELQNIYNTVSSEGSFQDILIKENFPKLQEIGSFHHAMTHIRGGLLAVLALTIDYLDKDKEVTDDHRKNKLDSSLRRKKHSQMALEIFKRVANDKRIIPGTTFTVYLPIAEGLVIEKPRESNATL